MLVMPGYGAGGVLHADLELGAEVAGDVYDGYLHGLTGCKKL